MVQYRILLSLCQKLIFIKMMIIQSLPMIKQVGIVLSLDLVYERVVLLLESSDVIIILKREERYFKKSLLIPLFTKE